MTELKLRKKNGVLSFILLVSLVFNGVFIFNELRESSQQDHHFTKFINHLYLELNQSIDLIGALTIEEGLNLAESEAIVALMTNSRHGIQAEECALFEAWMPDFSDEEWFGRGMNQLRGSLNALNIMMNQTAMYSESIPEYFHSWSFEGIINVIELGTSRNGILIPPIGQNGTLSEGERAFLIELRIVLMEIRDGLQSSETGVLDSSIHPTRVGYLFQESRIRDLFLLDEMLDLYLSNIPE